MKFCNWHRFLVSWRTDGKKDFHAGTTTHIFSCPDCREWWQQQRSLEAHLSEAAKPGASENLSPRFNQVVLQLLVKPHPPSRGFNLSWGMVGAGGATLAILLGVMIGLRPNATQQAASTEPLIKLKFPDLSAMPARVDDPLEKELRLVIADTRKAVTFVAYNFLPDE